MHCASGVLAFITFYALARSYFAAKHTAEVLPSILFALFASLAVAVLWEIIEFTYDSLFLTNAQKFIPTDENLFNGGNSGLDLNGSDSEIASFYRNPDGYKFALKDTMMDCVVCFIGSLASVAATAVINTRFPYAFENGFAIIKK